MPNCVPISHSTLISSRCPGKSNACFDRWPRDLLIVLEWPILCNQETRITRDVIAGSTLGFVADDLFLRSPHAAARVMLVRSSAPLERTPFAESTTIGIQARVEVMSDQWPSLDCVPIVGSIGRHIHLSPAA